MILILRQGEWPDAVAPLQPRYTSFLAALLHCRPAALRQVERDRFIAGRGRGGQCGAAGPVVVKTIRLTVEHARALLAADPALRLVHLTRSIRNTQGTTNCRYIASAGTRAPFLPRCFALRGTGALSCGAGAGRRSAGKCGQTLPPCDLSRPAAG